MRAMVLICLATSVAHAEAPDPSDHACRSAPPNVKLSLRFGTDASVHDLVTWIAATTCKNVVVDAGVAKHALKATIVAPNRYTPKQALELVIDAIEATGLAVTQKPNTVIIKPGPGMPRACPDLAPPQRSYGGDLEDPFAAEIDAGIRKLAEHRYEIERSLIEKMSTDPDAFTRKGARVVPAMKDGAVHGFKLYAIRPTSVFAKLGFTNGDTVVRVGTHAITSIESALEAFAKLRKSNPKRVEIAILRRGKPITLVFTIK